MTATELGPVSPPRPDGLGRAGAVRRAVLAGLLAAGSFCALVVLVQRADAAVALGVAVMAVAGLAMVARPEIATLLTIFLIYINFPAILTKQHGLPHVVAGSFVLLLGFPLLHFLLLRRESLRIDRTFQLMLVLLGVYLVASLGARDTGVALRTVMEYALEGLLLFWLIFNVVRSLPTLRRAIWTVLCAGAFLSALGLYQTATGNYRQEFGGLAYRNYELAQDRADGSRVVRRTWDRARGPLDEPNRFAQVLLVLVPLAAVMSRHARTPAARLAATTCGLLIVGGVLVTLSRGGLLTLLLLGAGLVALRWLRPSRVIVGVALVALAAPSVPFLTERVGRTARAFGLVEGDAPATTGSIDSASLIRMSVMVSAFQVFLDHPVLGVGPGQFSRHYVQAYARDPETGFRDLPPGDWRAHSLYLEIAAETGLIGLAAFLAIVLVLLHRLWSVRRRCLHGDPELADMAAAFAMALVAYQVSGVFLHLSYQPYYWFLVAMASVAVHLTSTIRRPEPVGSALERTWPRSP